MLSFYHILIVGGVILWDFGVVAYVAWRSLQRPVPKLLKRPRGGRKRSLDIEESYTDMW